MIDPVSEQSPISACLGKTFSQKAITVSVLALSTAAIAISFFALLQGYLPLIGGVFPMHAWIVLGSATAADAFMIALCFYRIYQAHQEIKKQGRLQELLNNLGILAHNSMYAEFKTALDNFIKMGGDITGACDGKKNLLHMILDTREQMGLKLNYLLKKAQNLPDNVRKEFLNFVSHYKQSPLSKLLVNIQTHYVHDRTEQYEAVRTLVAAGADVDQISGENSPRMFITNKIEKVFFDLKGIWQRVQAEMEEGLRLRQATAH